MLDWRGDPGRTTIQYDGDNRIRVSIASHEINLNARPPATLSLSPDQRYVAHNFGDGSGQVYSLDLRDTQTGAKISLADFENEFRRRMNRAGCKQPTDEFSYVFERWLSSTSFSLKTEDWTRRPGCEVMAKEWVVRLPERRR